MTRAFNPLFALLLAVLSGCAFAPQRVSVEVPVPCVRELPERPHVRTPEELMALDRYRRTVATWTDRMALDAYSRELEAVLAGCTGSPGEPPSPSRFPAP